MADVYHKDGSKTTWSWSDIALAIDGILWDQENVKREVGGN